MGNVNKTDKLDARGLATLLRNGTLPTVWIAPSEVRDERELPRTRMALCKIRVALKNRIHATLAKYNLSLPTESDIFAPKWSSQVNQVIEQLPPETQTCAKSNPTLDKGSVFIDENPYSKLVGISWFYCISKASHVTLICLRFDDTLEF